MSSVPIEQRKPGQLEVNTEARRMCAYTLRITANPKQFDPAHGDIIRMIRNYAVDICTIAWEANEIKVGSSEERYNRRMELQQVAADRCNRLCCLIELAQPVFHITTRRKCYWKKMIEDVRNLIRGWHDSDVKRLKPQT